MQRESTGSGGLGGAASATVVAHPGNGHYLTARRADVGGPLPGSHAMIARPERPHLLQARQHRGSQRLAGAPLEVDAAWVVTHPGRLAGERAVEVRRVNDVFDLGEHSRCANHPSRLIHNSDTKCNPQLVLPASHSGQAKAQVQGGSTARIHWSADSRIACSLGFLIEQVKVSRPQLGTDRNQVTGVKPCRQRGVAEAPAQAGSASRRASSALAEPFTARHALDVFVTA